MARDLSGPPFAFGAGVLMQRRGRTAFIRGRSRATLGRAHDGTLEARLGAKIAPQPDGCWLWTGYITQQGYGAYAAQKGYNKIAAHRFVYETLVRPLDSDEVVHHTCFVKSCVNPAHLEPMTNAEHLALHRELERAGR